MNFLLSYFERQPPKAVFTIALIVSAAVGLLDHFIGPELSSAIFYVLPIAIAAWFGNRQHGFAISTIAAVIWLLTDMTSGREYYHPSVVYWNAFTRLAMFLVIAHLLSSFRERLRLEETAADTDVLTGILNARGFYEKLELATRYAHRYQHPLTIAYIDLDNFKAINDTLGHSAGDRLLATVAQIFKAQLRHTDIIARLGGDEFAIVLTETDYASSNTAIKHLQQCLLDGMRNNNWPVTFSIGMVTFEQVPEGIREMIKTADDLMYSVKKDKKNAIAHINWQAREE